MKDINKNIPPKKVVMYEEDTGVLRMNHMSQHNAQYVEPHHMKNKKQPS